MYKLSSTAKMPGKSFSLPASKCHTGSILSLIKGSVCEKCYAKKGSYCYKNTVLLRENNYDEYEKKPETFMVGLHDLINEEYQKTGVEYFRWFDSGDLADSTMLIRIVKIAYLMPFMNFWLPTKEYSIVNEMFSDLSVPKNLNVRLSVPMIDGDYFKNVPDGVNQTRVISSVDKLQKDELLCSGKCVECKYSCWKSNQKIAYVKH